MYRKPSSQIAIDDFILPFSGKLSAENRWVQLARIIPWDEIEKEYAFMFPSDRGKVSCRGVAVPAGELQCLRGVAVPDSAAEQGRII